MPRKPPPDGWVTVSDAQTRLRVRYSVVMTAIKNNHLVTQQEIVRSDGKTKRWLISEKSIEDIELIYKTHLRVAEAAEELGFQTTASIYNYVKQGVLTSTKVFGKLYIDKKSLMELAKRINYDPRRIHSVVFMPMGTNVGVYAVGGSNAEILPEGVKINDPDGAVLYPWHRIREVRYFPKPGA